MTSPQAKDGAARRHQDEPQLEAASIIKSIAPALASNVNVILYSCNAGREPDETEDWVTGTMRPGGKSSLAAVTRDALIAEGKSGSVWGPHHARAYRRELHAAGVLHFVW